MKQVFELLQKNLIESKNQIAHIADIFNRYGFTYKTEHLINDKKELEQFVDELQRAINILSDSCDKICTDGEQTTTDIEPNNSADAPSP